MINTIINSIKFNNKYLTNAFIYRLRGLPLIGKYIPKDLYDNYLLEILINLGAFLYILLSPFIGKFIYLLFFLVIPLGEIVNPYTFIHIFVFLTLIGGVFNTDMFNPSKNKYYAIVLMRMNPKRYAISNFIFFCFKLLISFYPSVILFGLMYGVNIFILLLLPIFVVLVKFIGNMFFLKIYDIRKKVITENNFFLIGTVTVIGLILAYLPLFTGISINYILFIVIFIISLIVGIISLIYIFKNNNYSKIYKSMLTLNNVIFDQEETSKRNNRKNYLSKIDNIKVTSNKNGYAYFNELFMMRHSNILYKSALKFALIILVIFIILGITSFYDLQTKLTLNNFLLNALPYFVFIMYFTNRGSVITQAMFINCDNSMLTYRFYRSPKAILALFWKRLLSVIKINMFPSLVISLGLPILLFITGGSSNPYDYGLIFISIINLSIFFSVHHLVIYYLLQPYDINMKAKSTTYGIVNGVTYFLCYMCIDLKMPTTMFTSFIIIFTLLYIGVSLFLVYKYAPRSFKLK